MRKKWQRKRKVKETFGNMKDWEVGRHRKKKRRKFLG